MLFCFLATSYSILRVVNETFYISHLNPIVLKACLCNRFFKKSQNIFPLFIVQCFSPRKHIKTSNFFTVPKKVFMSVDGVVFTIWYYYFFCSKIPAISFLTPHTQQGGRGPRNQTLNSWIMDEKGPRIPNFWANPTIYIPLTCKILFLFDWIYIFLNSNKL